MNNYTNQLPPPHFSPRQHNRPDYTAAGISKQQSVTTRESLNSGIVIETREGDRVSLTSSSFTEMDAYMYDSKGLGYSGDTILINHQPDFSFTPTTNQGQEVAPPATKPARNPEEREQWI